MCEVSKDEYLNFQSFAIHHKVFCSEASIDTRFSMGLISSWGKWKIFVYMYVRNKMICKYSTEIDLRLQGIRNSCVLRLRHQT